jgi:MOSC domain-containing protein YiiM
MGNVREIGICKSKGEQILKVEKVKAIAGKGLINDRKFKDDNNKLNQITLIEIENIITYNNMSRCEILPLEFRRNIVTEGLKLNDLVGKEFFIGKVKVKSHDLCRPCKYLQKKLNQSNFIEKLEVKGGIRCEILSSGDIFVGDIIKY